MLIDDSWILKEKARIASRNSSSREAYTPLNIPSEEIPQFPIPFSNKSSVRSPRTISQSLSQQSIKSHAKEVVNVTHN